MFGYYRLDVDCPKHIRSYYKLNYCILCKSIGKYYGPFARLFLSYDVTFFMIMGIDDDILESIRRVKCVKSDKSVDKILKTDFMKNIATLNVQLVAAKLDDDIYDDQGSLKILAKRMLNKTIQSAQKNNASMWRIIEKEYGLIRESEKNNDDIAVIEQQFANMMTNIAVECFDIHDDRLLGILDAISKWLYLIDAIDDLEADIKKNRFNPLLKMNSLKDIRDKYYMDILQHIKMIFCNIDHLDTSLHLLKNLTIERLVNVGVPMMTYNILIGK